MSAVTESATTRTYRPPPRAYRSIALAALRGITAYRLAFVMSSLGTVFLLLTMLYLWRTILASGAQAGFSWPQMKAYLLVAFVANTVVSTSSDYRMASRIRDGMVAIDLTRPISYQLARFAEASGYAIFEYASSILFILVAMLVFGGVTLPTGLHAALFVLSLLLVLPLKFAVVYSTTLLCFWTQNYMGINWARTAITNLMSGALIPLAFFPAWLKALGEALPFQCLAYTPAMLFLGRFSDAGALLAVAVQVGWTIVLWLLASLAWGRASRRLTVQGG